MSSEVISTTAQIPNAEIIKTKISELEATLRSGAPEYEKLLYEIHKALVNDEETVHILTEEQIGVICVGLQKKTNVVISEAHSKKNSNKKLSSVSAEDV